MPIYQKGTSSWTTVNDMYICTGASAFTRICKVYICTGANTFTLVYDGCAVACDCDACEPCDFTCVYQDEEVTGTFNCGTAGNLPEYENATSACAGQTGIWRNYAGSGSWSSFQPGCYYNEHCVFTNIDGIISLQFGVCYIRCCPEGEPPQNCPAYNDLQNNDSCCSENNGSLICSP